MSWRARIAIAVALAALVAVSFAARWHVLAESQYPVGVDGFFYPIQVRALLEHGALQYPASPLTFWWMAPFAALTDPITGAKLGAALGGALIAVPAWGVGARLARNPWAGLVAAALAAGSAGSAYLSLEFVKQGIGLTVGLAALWLVMRALEARTRGGVAAAAAGVLATLLAHKLAALIVIVVAARAVMAESVRHLRGRRLLYAYIGGTAALLVVLLLGLVAPQRFISPTDLALVGHAFSRHAHWSLPVLATGGFTLTLEHEALIGGALGVAAALVLMLPRKRDALPRATKTAAPRVIAWSFVVMALAIAIPWLDVSDPQGLAFRARTVAFLPLAMCAAIVAGELAARIPTSPRIPARIPTSPRIPAAARTAVLIILAAALSLRAAEPRREGRILAHPALVAAALAASDQVPANATLVVSERHIEYMVAYFSQRPVSLRPEPIPHGQRVRLLALADMSPELQAAIDAARADPSVTAPVGLHPRHRNGLVLIEEPTWDWILARLPGPVRRHYERWPTL